MSIHSQGRTRRGFVRSLAGVGGAAVLSGGALLNPATAAAAQKSRNVMRNAGAGMHAGPDTAFGLSSFTINPNSVTCGVGSLGNAPGAIPNTAGVPTGLASSGPFAMFMYSTVIDRYEVDRPRRRLFAYGEMRSITTMGTQLVEDVVHPFQAEAIDHRDTRPDEFYLHFLTPFWAPAANPMATKSSLVPDWAMFGSAILLGEVNVG